MSDFEYKGTSFQEIESNEGLRSEFLSSAPLHYVMRFNDWKRLKAQEGMVTSSGECPVHGVMTRKHQENEKPKCLYCDKELAPTKSKEKGRGIEFVTVPAYYDEQGKPMKGSPMVRVSRRASEIKSDKGGVSRFQR